MLMDGFRNSLLAWLSGSLMRAAAQESDENNRADDGNDNRTDAAESIGKESEHRFRFVSSLPDAAV